jgi:hypothetical protein
MNKSINLAKGDYLIFMNIGDTYYNKDVPLKFSLLSEIHRVALYFGASTEKLRVNLKKKCKPISSISRGVLCQHQSLFLLRDTIFSYNTKFKYARLQFSSQIIYIKKKDTKIKFSDVDSRYD